MKLEELAKVDMTFSVNMYDNGFMVEVNGRNSDDDWVASRTISNTPAEVLKLIETILSMPKVD
jgi:hypothetical protein